MADGLRCSIQGCVNPKCLCSGATFRMDGAVYRNAYDEEQLHTVPCSTKQTRRRFAVHCKSSTLAPSQQELRQDAPLPSPARRAPISGCTLTAIEWEHDVNLDQASQDSLGQTCPSLRGSEPLSMVPLQYRHGAGFTSSNRKLSAAPTLPIMLQQHLRRRHSAQATGNTLGRYTGWITPSFCLPPVSEPCVVLSWERRLSIVQNVWPSRISSRIHAAPTGEPFLPLFRTSCLRLGQP